MTGGPDDIEWLDADDATPQADEELRAGSRRPPMRRRTRIALGGVATVALAGLVALGLTTGGAEDPGPTTTRSVAPSRSSERTVDIELPQRAPRPAVVAIRAAFPKADLFGFSAAIAEDTKPGLFLSYNLRSGRRLITVTVGPPRLGEADAVLRTATSVEIAQLLGKQRVTISLRTEKGAPTAKDFAALQRLVQDARLLATQ